MAYSVATESENNRIQPESESVAVLGYPISQPLKIFPVLPHYNSTSERGSFFLKLLCYSQLIFATSYQTISTFELYFSTRELLVRLFLMGQPRNECARVLVMFMKSTK